MSATETSVFSPSIFMLYSCKKNKESKLQKYLSCKGHGKKKSIQSSSQINPFILFSFLIPSALDPKSSETEVEADLPSLMLKLYRLQTKSKSIPLP